MRTVLTIGAVLLGSGTAQAAPDQSPLMGPGSSVYWTSAHDGNADRFRETLLAQGEDFALFKTESEWAAGDEADYFALFSGIYYNTCDLEMPTAEERAALAGLWPLTEGGAVELSSDQGAIVEVGSQTEYYLMGQMRDAHSISLAYLGDDPSEETIFVLDALPLTVAIHWQDGSQDSATLVTRPRSVASTPVDTDLIGNCASLLNNQTEQK